METNQRANERTISRFHACKHNVILVIQIDGRLFAMDLDSGEWAQWVSKWVEVCVCVC